MVKSIDYCHQQNIIHRDVKLENFLVNVDDDSLKIDVKLTDFGYSKVLI